MKAWEWVAAIVIPGGAIVALVVWLRRRRRRHEFWTGPHYVDQIATLAPTRPMRLPPVRTLKSTVRSASPFGRRQRA